MRFYYYLLDWIICQEHFQGTFRYSWIGPDDVDEKNEKELKFIIDSFSKFASNPDHVYQALRSEFLFGNNFSALLPHLMRYFVRHDPQSNKIDEISVLLKTKSLITSFTKRLNIGKI